MEKIIMFSLDSIDTQNINTSELVKVCNASLVDDEPYDSWYDPEPETQTQTQTQTKIGLKVVEKPNQERVKDVVVEKLLIDKEQELEMNLSELENWEKELIKSQEKQLPLPIVESDHRMVEVYKKRIVKNQEKINEFRARLDLEPINFVNNFYQEEESMETINETATEGVKVSDPTLSDDYHIVNVTDDECEEFNFDFSDCHTIKEVEEHENAQPTFDSDINLDLYVQLTEAAFNRMEEIQLDLEGKLKQAKSRKEKWEINVKYWEAYGENNGESLAAARKSLAKASKKVDDLTDELANITEKVDAQWQALESLKYDQEKANQTLIHIHEEDEFNLPNSTMELLERADQVIEEARQYTDNQEEVEKMESQELLFMDNALRMINDLQEEMIEDTMKLAAAANSGSAMSNDKAAQLADLQKRVEILENAEPFVLKFSSLSWELITLTFFWLSNIFSDLVTVAERIVKAIQTYIKSDEFQTHFDMVKRFITRQIPAAVYLFNKRHIRPIQFRNWRTRLGLL